MTNFNQQLTGTQLQSGLGRVREVYNQSADSLTLAHVVRVNYIYNTVDVETSNGEVLVKGHETKGRFSAKLPVSFGGRLFGTLSYGSSIPVNIGDTVLIGFLQKDKNNAIVLGVYQSEDVANELAPTDKYSGDPTDRTTIKDTLSQFKLNPGQTYTYLDGVGNLETTYQGKSFFKSATGLFGSGKLNDHGYGYQQLQRRLLRGREISPITGEAPQMLLQHTGDDQPLVTNVLLDSNGDYRVSNTSKFNDQRVDMQLSSTTKAKLRYQSDNKVANMDASKWAELGVEESLVFLRNQSHKIEVKDDGIYIDDKPISSITGGSIDQEQLDKIQQSIDSVKEGLVSKADLSSLNDKVTHLENDISVLLNGSHIDGSFTEKIEQARKDANMAISLATNTANTVAGAAGSDRSLVERLERMETATNSLGKLAQEIVKSRNYKGVAYNDLPSRLNDIQDIVRNTVDRLKDYESYIARLVTLEGEHKRLSDDFYSLRNKLDSFLRMVPDNRINDYVVSVTPDKSPVFRNGQGSVTLSATAYKMGFNQTGLIDDQYFVWTRKSSSPDDDNIWNNQHSKGSKSLTINADEVGFSTDYICELRYGDGQYAKGRQTVTNIRDQRPIRAALSTDQKTTQFYTPSTGAYTPDFTNEPQVLTLSLYDSSGYINLVDHAENVNWMVKIDGVEVVYSGLSASGSHLEVATIDTNIPFIPETALPVIKDAQMEVTAFGEYIDDVTKASTPFSASMTFQYKVVSVGDLTLDAYSENGELFINSSPTAVNLVGNVYDSGVLSQEKRTYHWLRRNSDVYSKNDSRYDPDAGIGWELITTKYPNADVSVAPTTVTTGPARIAIREVDVENSQVYLLIVAMQEAHKGVLLRYSKTIQSFDNVDLVIESPNGNVFKNGKGYKQLKARLYSSTDEIDPDGKFNYKWSCYDGSGNLLDKFGGDTPFKYGKTIKVDYSEVSDQSNIEVDFSDEG